MNINELSEYLRSLPEEVITGAAYIVAGTAKEEFTNSFEKKAFDGNPWAPAKNPRKTGSLLVKSGHLKNSIEAITVSREKVVISAGNKNVTYAKIHNEGFVGDVNVPAHTRTTQSRSVVVPEYTRRTKNGNTKVEAHTWNIKGGTQQVKAHKRKENIPKRQFMGDSKKTNELIHKNVSDYVESFFKNKK